MSVAKPSASVAHRSHGRTRLKFRRERGNQQFFDGLVLRLRGLPDVKSAEARPLTGSVIVHHQGLWSEIAEQIVEAGLFAIAEEEAATDLSNAFGQEYWLEVAKQLSRTGLFIENEAQALKSLERLSPALAAAGGAAILGLWQIARGEVLPPAITLLMYARTLACPLIATLSRK